jgi:hypothetical protein
VTKFAPGEEIDTALMRRFVTEKEHWDPTIADTVVFDRVEHVGRGIMIFVTHDPMPKNRLVIPLAVPFVIAADAPSQREAEAKWAKIVVATAERLGLADAIDMTGVDLSRLFFFPRHKKGAPHDTAIAGGPLFDWRTLELENPYEAIANEVSKGSGKSKTPEGKALGRWSMKAAHGFQIVDVRNARIKSVAKHRQASILNARSMMVITTLAIPTTAPASP